MSAAGDVARPFSIMISAGEASGDTHAAHALASLRARLDGVAESSVSAKSAESSGSLESLESLESLDLAESEVSEVSAGPSKSPIGTADTAVSGRAPSDSPFTSFGMGAGSLAAEGTELVVDCRDLAVIGIVDVLLNYPKFLRRLRLLRDAMRERRPDLLVIVDYPDFNLKLAETARELGIPVLFYISPQIWAWRAKRVHRIGSLVTHMAVLFPFEVEVYERAGVPVTYVGHPLVDDAVSPFTTEEARTRLGVDGAGPLVTLLPGSRRGELQRHLPVMLATAARLRRQLPGCRFLLPLATTLDRTELDALIDEALGGNGHDVDAPGVGLRGGDVPRGDVRGGDIAGGGAPRVEAFGKNTPALPLTIVEGDACHAMRAADAVLASSGTATLETALIGTPLVVMYIVAPLNHAIMRRLIRIPDIALVNVVAGRRIVPEYVQQAATPEVLTDELHTLLTDDTAAATMRSDLADVRDRMGDGGASNRVAALIEEMLGTTRDPR